jgi:hypothetical protein
MIRTLYLNYNVMIFTICRGEDMVQRNSFGTKPTILKSIFLHYEVT